MEKICDFEQKLSMLCSLSKDFDFSKLSTIKIGPICKYYAVVHSISCLKKIIKLCNTFEVKYHIIGQASNVLFCGEYFDGLILKLGMDKTKVKGNKIVSYAGQKLQMLLNIAKQNSLSGLEWAVLIPASVGGAVVMNAGAYMGEISQVLKRVFALNLKTFKIEKFGILEYFPKPHKSLFTNNPNYVIIKAEFCLTKSTNEHISQNINRFVGLRLKSQNVGFPSLGSVFSRGETDFAPAYYIEQCGLKGKCFGDAQISSVHSGFIINKNKATCLDVLKLIDIEKEEVFKHFGVKLKCEIEIWRNEDGHIRL